MMAMDFGAGDKCKACGGMERLARAALAAIWTSVSPLAVGWPADAWAQSQAIEFDIPSQPIATALVAFARQANVRLVMSEEPSGGVTVNAVRGALDREQALARLLEGTGYEGRFEDGAIRLWRVSAGGGETPQRSAANEYDDDLVRVAQAQAAQNTSNDTLEPRERHDGPMEKEIVVVGTNIRGVYPASSPVEIYTAEDIARTGAMTTEQFIGKLPQNLGTRTQVSVGATLGSFNNREGVNSVDLRGLGVGTTLTLLNGRRLARANFGRTADISLIPAGAIERIEVLTDGASAVYGSDAIGGVVNFVLRDDFDGAESRLSYGGVTSGGLRQGDVTQTFGREWASGNALMSYNYYSASALDALDRDYAAPSGRGTLTPTDQRHSVISTASVDLGDRIRMNADAVFSSRDVKSSSSDLTNSNSANHSYQVFRSATEQYFVNMSSDFTLDESLRASVLGSYSAVEVNSETSLSRFNRIPPQTSTSVWDTNYSAFDVTAKLDGALFPDAVVEARFSVGIGYLSEQYTAERVFSGAIGSGGELGRATTYAFGELFVPVVRADQGVAFVHKLELSVAARYTSYDDTSDPTLGRDYGERTSPKLGLLWAPTEWLSLRTTYGESFRAPFLDEVDPTSTRNSIFRSNFAVAGVASPIFQVQGPSPDLDAETAKSYTIGFNFKLPSHPNLRLSGTYFNIDYIGRIASPSLASVLANPLDWPDLMFRPSSPTQIEEWLRSTPNFFNNSGIDLSDPAVASLTIFALPNLWLNDGRVRNLSLTAVDGFDLSADYQIDAPWATVAAGGQVTRIFNYDEQVTATAPVVSVVDTVLRPVDLRGRAYIDVTRGGLSSTISVNYIDDYRNPLNAGVQKIESWTTVDWHLVYEIGENAGNGLLEGVKLALSVQNLFDRDPPLVASNNDASVRLQNSSGFDPANASPLGRLAILGLTKTW